MFIKMARNAAPKHAFSPKPWVFGNIFKFFLKVDQTLYDEAHIDVDFDFQARATLQKIIL